MSGGVANVPRGPEGDNRAGVGLSRTRQRSQNRSEIQAKSIILKLRVDTSAIESWAPVSTCGQCEAFPTVPVAASALPEVP